MISQNTHGGTTNPFRAQARLETDDWLRATIHQVDWLLTDGDDLSDDDRQLLRWEKEAAEAELARRWARGISYPACDFGFERETIERIKTAWPIEAVIGLDVPLRPVGRGYRGKCPFHDGKSDNSLSVKPGVDGAFYCFGCRFGGDVLAWIMAFHRCEFSEALRRLAHMAGLPIPMRRRPQPPSKGPVREVDAYVWQPKRKPSRRGLRVREVGRV
ncbi:CHC2 zinc finger domain-containing protein [Sphaerobacter thermophilus]|uniref:Zinc finger CHC2-family protein n=1 Tax=Sphaerobacter thermophilus (strain ATCC 49802 / DSM 20745 / KCCM 41009 / NCIMB 13125 / S 6022) TaxID=479434 RepID=D1C8V4_SPHTD|nr:CHC2 zinc finger domain-containing protein [Sphaerobacter thermophilus]ACZ40247.1 zinc finger CHC2-family protein [Sphaerobacter thermophilus DSM 20745]